MKHAEQRHIFDHWLSLHQGILFKVVRAYAFTPHDQEDLFQEIAFQLWESVPRFREESAVTTWIYRVALYAALSWTRKEVRHRQQKSLTGSEHVLTWKSVEEEGRLQWLYDEIRQLDPIDRSLMLLLLEGFSYREMADTLGISPSNVGVKINRIKKALASRAAKEHAHGS